TTRARFTVSCARKMIRRRSVMKPRSRRIWPRQRTRGRGRSSSCGEISSRTLRLGLLHLKVREKQRHHRTEDAYRAHEMTRRGAGERIALRSIVLVKVHVDG